MREKTKNLFEFEYSARGQLARAQDSNCPCDPKWAIPELFYGRAEEDLWTEKIDK